MEELVFTPSSILDFLSQIEELRDKDIQVIDTSGGVQISIGESIYMIDDSNATDIEVDSSVVEDIEDVNESAYDELEMSGEIELSEPVESGILRQIAKTLAIGGLVRLTTKLLK